MKIRVDRGDHFVEYELTTIILRFVLLLVIIFFISISINYIVSTSNSENEFQNALDNDALTDYESLVVKENSRGSFYSLKENVYAEGSISKSIKDKNNYIEFGSNFKITNNYNLELLLSTTPTGRAQIRIGKLLGNIGKQEYLIPENVNLDVHKYVILWDSQKREALAYAVISDN
jgi:hypothetical protein